MQPITRHQVVTISTELLDKVLKTEGKIIQFIEDTYGVKLSLGDYEREDLTQILTDLWFDMDVYLRQQVTGELAYPNKEEGF